MRLAFPHANHRNNQEDEGRNLEKRAAERTVGDGGDGAKQCMNDKNCDVQR